MSTDIVSIESYSDAIANYSEYSLHTLKITKMSMELVSELLTLLKGFNQETQWHDLPDKNWLQLHKFAESLYPEDIFVIIDEYKNSPVYQYSGCLLGVPRQAPTFVGQAVARLSLASKPGDARYAFYVSLKHKGNINNILIDILPLIILPEVGTGFKTLPMPACIRSYGVVL